MKQLIANNSVNNKVRDLIFGYVIVVIMIVMSINSINSKESMVFIKSYGLPRLILPQLS